MQGLHIFAKWRWIVVDFEQKGNAHLFHTGADTVLLWRRNKFKQVTFVVVVVEKHQGDINEVLKPIRDRGDLISESAVNWVSLPEVDKVYIDVYM